MIGFCRPVMLFRNARLKLAAVTISVLIILFPAKAEENRGRKGASSATVYASAKIHKRFDIRPENYIKSMKAGDHEISDISFRECDIEVRQAIKKCILMIYEIQ